MRKYSQAFSFQDLGSEKQLQESVQEEAPRLSQQDYRIIMDSYKYRHQQSPLPIYNWNKEIQGNIRRRMELQSKLHIPQQIALSKNRIEKVVEAVIEPQIDLQIKKLASLEKQKKQVQKQKAIKVREIPKPPLDPAQILHLSRVLTFPELPTTKTLIKCQDRLQQLLGHHQHSDLHYLLMVVHYHLSQHRSVEDCFKQLLRFRVVNPQAYWIMAESYYRRTQWEKCYKITQLCLDKVSNLSRIMFLRATSAFEIGKFTEAIVLYSRIIQLQPRIAQYYLKRAILYHRTGMKEDARQDFSKYRELKPDWHDVIKEQIILERDRERKQGLIKTFKLLSDF